MIKKTKSVMLILLIVFLCTAILAIYSVVNASPSLSLAEARSIVQEQYEGEIIAAKQAGKNYLVTLTTLAGTYEMTVPKKGGGIANIAKLEDATESTMVAEADPANAEQNNMDVAADDKSIASASPAQGDNNVEKTSGTSSNLEQVVKPSSKPKSATTPLPSSTPTASAILSEKKAGELALKQVAGEIDDIELISHKDQRYYLIEIEAANGQDAAVQINAITGKVMSISWENDDQLDDDDDAHNNSDKDD